MPSSVFRRSLRRSEGSCSARRRLKDGFSATPLAGSSPSCLSVMPSGWNRSIYGRSLSIGPHPGWTQHGQRGSAHQPPICRQNKKMTHQIASRVVKTLLQAAQKDLRGEARSWHMADSLWHIVGTIRYKPAGARRLSATKHMSLFQQPARAFNCWYRKEPRS